MLSREHDIQQHPKRIDVRPLVRLGNPVLLRRGIARGSQNLRVLVCVAFENAGSVKVDEYRLAASDHHIFRLDVPMHRAQLMQHPQGVAQLPGDFPRFSGGEQRALQKVGKYNHSPDYMSSRDGTERPTEKQLYEGDKELTHLCLRVDTDEAFCVIEERKSGVTLGAVVRYFNLLLRNYLLSQGNETPIVLFASIVPSEDFMSALNSAEKITIAELFVQKDVMGSGYLNYLEVDASTREDVVMTVKAKPRQSFTKRALRDTYIKMTTEGTEIKRIRLRGKDVNQMSVVIDSLNAKRKDEVYVELDQSGIVISSSIFSKMEEAIVVESTEV